MRLLAYMFLCLMCLSFTHQTPPSKNYQTLDNIRNRMSEKKFYSKIQLKFYESYASKTPLQSEVVEVNYQGEFLHYKNDEIEAFRTNKYIVNIDHENKFILVNSNNRKSKQMQISAIEKLFLDSLVSSAFNILTIDSNATTTRFRIIPNSNEHQIRSADMVFKSNTLEPISLEVFYNVDMETLFGLNRPGKEQLGINLKSKPRLTIDYIDFKYQPAFNVKDFSFSQYVNTTTHPFSAGPSASNYQVIDYSQPKKGKK